MKKKTQNKIIKLNNNYRFTNLNGTKSMNPKIKFVHYIDLFESDVCVGRSVGNISQFDKRSCAALITQMNANPISLNHFVCSILNP